MNRINVLKRMPKMDIVKICLIFCLVLHSMYGSAQEERNEPYRHIILDSTFEAYFNRFKLLVRNRDKEGMANHLKSSYGILLISFDPETINSKPIRIKNKAMFLKYYDKIFTKRMRDLISKQTVKDLKLLQGNIMLGNGQVWWDYDREIHLVRTLSLFNSKTAFRYEERAKAKTDKRRKKTGHTFN